MPDTDRIAKLESRVNYLADGFKLLKDAFNLMVKNRDKGAKKMFGIDSEEIKKSQQDIADIKQAVTIITQVLNQLVNKVNAMESAAANPKDSIGN